jgi:hypothetical protein
MPPVQIDSAAAAARGIPPSSMPEQFLLPTYSALDERTRAQAVESATAIVVAWLKMLDAEDAAHGNWSAAQVAKGPKSAEEAIALANEMSKPAAKPRVKRDGTTAIAYGFEEELARTASKLLDEASEVVQRNLSLMGKVLGREQEKIDRTFTIPPRVASEHRAAILRAGMTADERAIFVSERIVAGDRDTFLSVLGAQPYVSGLEDEAITDLRLHAEKVWLPREIATRDAIAKAIGAIERAAKAFADQVQIFLDQYASAQASRADRSAAIRAAGGVR